MLSQLSRSGDRQKKCDQADRSPFSKGPPQAVWRRVASRSDKTRKEHRREEGMTRRGKTFAPNQLRNFGIFVRFTVHPEFEKRKQSCRRNKNRYQPNRDRKDYEAPEFVQRRPLVRPLAQEPRAKSQISQQDDRGVTAK